VGALDAAAQYVPDGHWVGDDDPAGQYDPTGHTPLNVTRYTELALESPTYSVARVESIAMLCKLENEKDEELEVVVETVR
jgi:hypothetical protein